MHVALQIVLAKWFPSGLPVVTKYTKYTSARAKTGAKTGRISGNSGRHLRTGAHLGRFWTPRANRSPSRGLVSFMNMNK